MVSPLALISLAVRPSTPHDFDGDNAHRMALTSSYVISLKANDVDSLFTTIDWFCPFHVIFSLSLGPIEVK